MVDRNVGGHRQAAAAVDGSGVQQSREGGGGSRVDVIAVGRCGGCEQRQE
jgi:hypothetical protein